MKSALARRGLAAGLFAAALSGCTVQQMAKPPAPVESTPMQMTLTALPPPARKVPVTVFKYPDLTGQYKPSQTVQSYSRAVSQGGLAVLAKALIDAGNGQWFTVLEREGLDSLLKERAIIRETRAAYLSGDGRQLPPPPPLLYSGIIFEGGIVGYDSNTLTGGAGARYLGIGGSTEYREDTVTVSLRAVSTQSGEVLKMVSAKKTILSYGLSASVFRFVAFKELLEIEAGLTQNEPGFVALQQAIEHAVYAMVVEGAMAGLWDFQNPADRQRVIDEYRIAGATLPDPARLRELEETPTTVVRDQRKEPEASKAEAKPVQQGAYQTSAREKFWDG